MIKKLGFIFLAAAMVMAVAGCNKEATKGAEEHPETAKPADAKSADDKPLDHPAH